MGSHTNQQSRTHLLKHRKQLRDYIRRKEELSNQNIATTEQRGRWYGYVSSLLPPIKFGHFLKNYAEKKGVIYKLFHPFSPYIHGRDVLFVDFRRFWGAKIKYFITSRNDAKSLQLRMRNLGFAQALVLVIDHQIHSKKESNQIRFYCEVIDQIRIKRAFYFKEYIKIHKLSHGKVNRLTSYDIDRVVTQQGRGDGYYQLLMKIQLNADRDTIDKARMQINNDRESLRQNWNQYYGEKTKFLHILAKKAVNSHFLRGTNCSYHHLIKRFKTTDKAINSILDSSPQIAPATVTPQRNFNFAGSPQLSLKWYNRTSDNLMRMKIEQDNYSNYTIKGHYNDRLVGKDNQLLEDGWYQFVILAELKNKQPVLRYYPCGESQDFGTPFIKQEPKRSDNNIYQDKNKNIVIQNPVDHHLPYSKYITHSQLAGGRPVRVAGAFMIKGGKLRLVDDSSGHYGVEETNDNRCLQPLLTAQTVFEHFGIITQETVFEHWQPYYGVDKLAKKLASSLYQIFPSPLSRQYQIEPVIAEDRATQPGKKSPTQIITQATR